MSEAAIRVENLSKQFRIGARIERYQTLRDALTEAVKAPFRKAGRLLRGEAYGAAGLEETIWALKDISFEVEPGEVIGIIGRNGAGKSTLLKVLSRITEPTEGWAEIRGRLASLLEVGTGFHPELTGRENAYLSGAILGMRKAEIDRKLGEIVAFSEVERFLDTPVKHYSSGMYVRLAFAVAAHLDPEILLIDEVLAVGDAAFQKKCLGKMSDVAQRGRTVLFVSHNIIAVRNLCKRVIWLDNGRVFKSGPAAEVTEEYLVQTTWGASEEDVPDLIASLPKDPVFQLLEANVRQDGKRSLTVVNGKPVEVEIGYRVFELTRGLRVYFDLCDEDQSILIRSFHDDEAEEAPVLEPGCYWSVAEIPANLLAPRPYMLILRATIHNVRSLLPLRGVPLELKVRPTSNIGRAYVDQTVRAKLQPRIVWRNTRSE